MTGTGSPLPSGDRVEAASPSAARRRWRDLVWLLAVFLVCYSSVWTNDYGRWDDYPVFVDRAEFRIDFWLLEARPVYGVVGYLFAWFVENLSDIRWLRIIGICGVALAAWCVFLELVRQGFDRIQSFFVAVIVGSAVPFQIAAAWATVAPYPYAFAISYVAFRVAEHSLIQRILMKYILIFLSFVLLSMSFLIYQPIALSFWVFVAIGILSKKYITASDIRRVLLYIGISGAAAVLSFLTYKTAVHYLGEYYPLSIRGALTRIEGIPREIGNLFSDIIAAAIFPIDPRQSWFQEINWGEGIEKYGAPIVVLTGLYLYFAARPSLWLRIAFACAAPVLCHGVMLISAEDWNPKYSQYSFYAIAVLYTVLAIHGYAKRIGKIIPLVSANTTIGFMAIVSIALAWWHIEIHYVRPNVEEIGFIQRELAKQDLSKYESIHVIRPACPCPATVSGNYGWPSACQPWAPTGMVVFALRSLGGDAVNLKFSNSRHGEPWAPGPRTLVVDMQKGVCARRGGEDHSR